MTNPTKLIIVNILKNFLSLVRIKILAFKWGASQLGSFGQLLTFYNVSTRVMNFGTGAALNALLQRYNNQERKSLIVSVIAIISLSTLLISILTYLFADEISLLLLNSKANVSYFYLLGILGILYSINFFFETTLQADKNFRLLIKGQLFSILFAFISIIPLTYKYGIIGILFSMGIWLSTSILYFSKPFFKQYLRYFSLANINKLILLQVAKIGGSDLIRSILFFGSFLLLRAIIIRELTLNEIGQFQSIFSISNYVNVLIQGFVLYFFPTISGLIKTSQIKDHFSAGINFSIKIGILSITFLSIFPEITLNLLYSNEFNTLGYQLLILNFGKLFEIFYLIGIIVLLGQNKLKGFLIVELIRSFTILGFPKILMNSFGLYGLIWGINFSYMTTFIVIILLLKRYDFLVTNSEYMMIFLKFIFSMSIYIYLTFNFEFSYLVRIGYFIFVFSWLVHFRSKMAIEFFKFS